MRASAGDEILCEGLDGQTAEAFGILQQELRIAIQVAELHPQAREIGVAMEAAIAPLPELGRAVLPRLAKGDGRALINLDALFGILGRIALGWTWLRLATRAAKGLESLPAASNHRDASVYKGVIEAARYHCEWELPQIALPCALLCARNGRGYDMKPSWFGPKC